MSTLTSLLKLLQQILGLPFNLQFYVYREYRGTQDPENNVRYRAILLVRSKFTVTITTLFTIHTGCSL